MRGLHLAVVALVSLACGATAAGPTPAGAPDAPAQDGSAAPAGSGQPGSDAGAVIGGAGGGLDVPADGRPAPARCEQLAAPLPEPVVHATAYSRRVGHCGLAWTDAQGNVALEVNQLQLDGHPRWDLLSSAGTPLGSADAWRGVLFPSIHGYIIEQGNSGGANSSPDIQAVDPAGRLRGSTEVDGPALVVPSQRGELLVLGPVMASPAPPLPAFPWAAWVLRDDATTLWGPRTLPMQSATVGGGIDASGRVLVLQDGTAAFGAGTTAAQWFDRDGSALTGPFLLLASAAGPSARFETAPLIGGGLAVRRVVLDDASGIESSEWLVIVAAGRTSPAPAPEWLRSRPNTTLSIIGGARYALLPLGGDVSPCAQAVDIVSASGSSCVRVVLPIDGGKCRTRDLHRGLDGTILQALPADREPFVQAPDSFACTVRFWPAALR